MKKFLATVLLSAALSITALADDPNPGETTGPPAPPPPPATQSATTTILVNLVLSLIK